MSEGNITLLLQQIDAGNSDANERLLPLVYDELRRMAAGRMRLEAAGRTLQPTALVHEAWLRLGGDKQPNWKSRAHYFGAASEAMRRILVDSARRRLAQRRGGDQVRVSITAAELAEIPADDSRLVRLDEALEKFATEEPEKARLVKLHYFGGLTIEQASEALGITDRTARRWWSYSRAWLIKELR